MIRKGFYFKLGGKDVFVETRKIRKTERLAGKILRAMSLPDNPDTRKELLYWLRPATCEVRTLKNGRAYWEIAGSNFGGCGSFLDDGMTIILNLT